MYKYIAKRILMMIPVVIGVSLLVFTVLKLAPGDVARIVAGSEADDATVEEIRHELGLDRSYPEQYVRVFCPQPSNIRCWTTLQLFLR